MWLMLQQPRGDDFVIATGRAASVREFCDLAFAAVGLRADDHVVVSPALFRPLETPVVSGNPAKAKSVLAWSSSIPLEALIQEMVEADLRRHQERLL
jgi:GDPmannose 4,6-dehydratase